MMLQRGQKKFLPQRTSGAPRSPRGQSGSSPSLAKGADFAQLPPSADPKREFVTQGRCPALENNGARSVWLMAHAEVHQSPFMGDGTCRPLQCRCSFFLTSGNSGTPKPTRMGFPPSLLARVPPLSRISHAHALSPASRTMPISRFSRRGMPSPRAGSRRPRTPRTSLPTRSPHHRILRSCSRRNSSR